MNLAFSAERIYIECENDHLRESAPGMNDPKDAAESIGPDPSLLIVEDDAPFLKRLARAMEIRGFAVETAETVAEGIAKAKVRPPKYAVVDLRLADGSGLDVIEVQR